MNRKMMSGILGVCCLVMTGSQPLWAERVFYDDFSDASLTNDVPAMMDGTPVTWSATGSDQISADTGDLVIVSSTDSSPSAGVDGLVMTGETSIKSLVRLGSDGTIGFGARGHWALLNANGNAAIGRLGSGNGLRVIPTSFKPKEEDLLMQLDVVGDTFDLWIWRSNELFPVEPVVSVRDTFVGDNGVIVGGATANFPSTSDYEAVFRFVEVADAAIREPSTLAGDYSGDGILRIDDLDLLTTAIHTGSAETVYDVDQSGVVDLQDRKSWVTDLKQTWIGDANLDGEFSSGDLVSVFAAGTYEADVNAGWATGDFDGNGKFESGDLTDALADGGYEQGPRAAVSAVPEPAAWLMQMTCYIGIAIRRRKVLSNARRRGR